MRAIAQQICDKMPDYHSFTGFKFTPEHVLDWVCQFAPKDHVFILQEFSHLLDQNIYYSENKVRELLIRKVEIMATDFNTKNPIAFLQNAEFLQMQAPENSQSILLRILDEEIQKRYGIALNECGSVSQKYVIYLDDVLATGGTIHDDCKIWLETKNPTGETNLDKVTKGEKILIVNVLCKHSWGAYNVGIRLKMGLNSNALEKKLNFKQSYTIENLPPTNPNQRYNLVYPVRENQPEHVLKYFESAHPSNYLRKAAYKGEFAFRPVNCPKDEGFFSSPSNRIRLENIFLQKGIELLDQAEKLEVNHRPLGMTNPTKKCFGTGTLFFTWTNVPNTSPIVFWWKSKAWSPLFVVSNRGN